MLSHPSLRHVFNLAFLASVSASALAHSNHGSHSHPQPKTVAVKAKPTAKTTAPKPTVATRAQTVTPIRVGEIVPSLRLQSIAAPTHRVLDVAPNSDAAWSNTPRTLLFVGDNWTSAWTTALNDTHATLTPQQRATQEWTLVTPQRDKATPTQAASFTHSRDLSASFLPFPLRLDRENHARSLFGLGSSVSTWVQIDRAGFVRRVQPLRDTASLRNALLNDADTTPLLAEGQPAPDFRVRDMNSRPRSLREFRGRSLLLTFFPRCFTGGCVIHLSSLRDEYAKLQAAGVDVLAVSVDGADGVHGQKAFAKNLNLPFDLLPDTGRNLSMLYGAAASPEQVASRISILIDPNGVVRWIDRQINLQTHGVDVLAKVRELKSPNVAAEPQKQ